MKKNQLPPRFKNWAQFIFDMQQSADGEELLFKIGLSEIMYSDDSGYYSVDLDFLKARVFDEMWPNLDIEYGALMEIKMNCSRYGSDFVNGERCNSLLKKIKNLAMIRRK